MDARINILIWFIIALIALTLGAEVYIISTSGIPEDSSGYQLVFPNQ